LSIVRRMISDALTRNVVGVWGDDGGRWPADELAMPVDRVLAWGFVKADMSDVWSAEDWSSVTDRSPVSRALDVARLLLPRLS
jgi:hypothetical protein